MLSLGKMKKYFFRLVLVKLSLFFTTGVYAVGYSSDIPFAIQGFITIKGPGAIAQQSCNIVLSGRTNSATSQATLTAINYLGNSYCSQLNKAKSGMRPWSMSWTNADPHSIEFSNVILETNDIICSGNMTASRIDVAVLMLNKQTVGTCIINGMFTIIAFPLVDFYPGQVIVAPDGRRG